MERVNFAYLIGAEKNGIHWGRPMMFFAALSVSDLVSGLLFTLSLQFSKPESNYIFTPNSLFLAQETIINLGMAFLLLAIFYLIRNELLATLTAVILYPPFSLGISFVMSKIHLSLYAGTTFERPWLRMLLFSTIYIFFFVGGIES